MKELALGEYLEMIAQVTLMYREKKEAMKEWYDKRKAEL